MKIVIVSKNTFFQHALASILTAEDIDIALQVDDLGVLVKGGRGFPLDVDVLIVEDATLCSQKPFADLTALHRRRPMLKSLLVVPKFDAAFLSGLFEAGCAGCLSSNVPPAALPQYLRLAASGQRILPDGAADMLRQLIQEVTPPANATALMSKLTNREGRVLRQLLRGAPNKAIASCLQVPVTTVKGDVKSIMRKTGAANRTALVVSVMRKGFEGMDQPAPHYA